MQKWIESIGKKLGIGLRYTQRLYDVLVNRANRLKWQHRNLTGGAPRRRFFQKEWELKLVPGEIVTEVERSLTTKLNEATREIDEITEEKTVLQQKVRCMADKLKHRSPEI